MMKYKIKDEKHFLACKIFPVKSALSQQTKWLNIVTNNSMFSFLAYLNVNLS